MNFNKETIISTFALTSLCACAGPNYYFSDGPSPDWIRATPKGIDGKKILMVGSAPVTSQVQRDLDLAVGDAKAKIGQLFVSQVKARTTDWTLAVQSEDRQEERLVLNQQLEVRTEIKVEDPKIVGQFRDEESRTQYVEITVDRGKWSSKIEGRVRKGLANLVQNINAATEHIQSKQALAGYAMLVRASKQGQLIEADTIVIDLLNPSLGLGKSLAQNRSELDQLNQKLRKTFQFRLEVKSQRAELKNDLRKAVETFLNKYGFGLTTGGGEQPILISVELGQKAIKKERVGDRTEFVHAATGQLRVTEPDGSAVAGLLISLHSNNLEERAADKDLAIERALQLAVDTISSKFRSQFRTHFDP